MEVSQAEKQWLDEQSKRFSDRFFIPNKFQRISYIHPVQRFETSQQEIEYPLSRDYLESLGKNPLKSSKKLFKNTLKENHSILEDNAYQNSEHYHNTEASSEILESAEDVEYFQKHSLRDIILKLPNGISSELDSELGNPYWEWLSLLHNGFNLILYGLGSKIEILDFFQKHFLRDGTCCTINGCHDKFNFKSFLSDLMETLNLQKLESIYKRKSLPKELWQHLGTCSRPVYLIVNNIDSSTLSNFQKDLAFLASLPMVHLIGSVSNLRFEIHWDSQDLSNFNFIYKQCTSRIDYRDELLDTWEHSPPPWLVLECMESKNKEIQFDMILSALTSNHQRLIKIIANEQLRNPGQNGVLEETIFSNDSAFVIGMDRHKLNMLLVELISYQILQKFVSSRGKMSFVIPATREHIEKLATKDFQ